MGWMMVGAWSVGECKWQQMQMKADRRGRKQGWASNGRSRTSTRQQQNWQQLHSSYNHSTAHWYPLPKHQPTQISLAKTKPPQLSFYFLAPIAPPLLCHWIASPKPSPHSLVFGFLALIAPPPAPLHATEFQPPSTSNLTCPEIHQGQHHLWSYQWIGWSEDPPHFNIVDYNTLSLCKAKKTHQWKGIHHGWRRATEAVITLSGDSSGIQGVMGLTVYRSWWCLQSLSSRRTSIHGLKKGKYGKEQTDVNKWWDIGNIWQDILRFAPVYVNSK